MNTILQKLRTYALSCISIFFMISCNVDDKGDSNISYGVNKNAEWVKQLNMVKENGKKTLTKSMLVNNSNLKLLNYRFLGDIISVSELDELKSDLTSNKYCFPYYDIENSKITLLTFDQIESLNNYNYITYSRSSLNNFLDTTMNINLKKVEIEWECDNKNYVTICLVSEDEGIIYDNIITNTICLDSHVSETLKHAIETNITLPMNQTKSNGTPLRRSITWSTSINCSWLFGSERGSVSLSHTIYGYRDYLQYSTHSCDSHMNFGKAWAGMQLTSRLLGSGGYSDCAYGYYITTPSTTVNVNFSQGRYHIDLNWDFNSAISGSGNSYLSSSQFQIDN